MKVVERHRLPVIREMSPRASMAAMTTTANTAVCSREGCKRVHPKSPHHEKNSFSFFLSLLFLSIHEKMGVS